MSEAFGRLPISEAAHLAMTEGFEGVQLGLDFADIPRIAPGGKTTALTKRLCRQIHDAFKTAGVEIFAISAYVGLIDTDEGRRRDNLSFFKAVLRSARALGSRIVVTETGTLGTPGDNQGEEAWRALVESITELIPVAEAENTLIALEPTRTQTLSTAARAKKFVEQIGSPNLKLLIDPSNLLPRPEGSELEGMFDLMIPYLVAGHAKDVLFTDSSIEYPRAGLGQLDYPEFVRLMQKHLPGGPLIIEYVDKGNYRETRDFLKQVIASVNG